MSTITVKQLIDQLSGYGDDVEVGFGSTIAAVPLTFYRVKRRGDDLVQIELNEQFPLPGEYTVDVAKDMSSFQVKAPHLKARRKG